jgi:hypothetical protein
MPARMNHAPAAVKSNEEALRFRPASPPVETDTL